MTRYSFADLDQWAAKSERRMTAVLRQATNDMLSDIKISTGLTRGGSVERGTIPRDLGALANSLQSSLFGSTALTGEDSYVMVIGQMEAGDAVRFTWGGNIAPYALPIHYGFGTYPGTFWRDDAAQKWPGYVLGAVAKGKALVP